MKKFAIGSAVGLVLALVLWAGARLWLDANGERLREMGRVATEEGQAFAQENDQDACVTEGLRRGEAAGAFFDRVSGRIFTSACLPEATPTPKLCVGVPERTQLLAAAEWRVAECTRHGYPGDSFCNSHLAAVQEFCHPDG